MAFSELSTITKNIFAAAKTTIATCSVFTIIFACASCAERDKDGKLLDQISYGTITIAVDESLKPLIDAELDTFEAIYRGAHINVIYSNEDKAIRALLKDSARLAIVTRSLTPEETDYLLTQKINAREQKIAEDGIAIIVNRASTDTLMFLDDFRKLLTQTNTMSEIDKRYSSTPKVVVFDEPNSGIIRYLRDSVVQFDRLPAYCYAVNGNPQVINYVSQNPNAIGLIDVSWISDRDDSTTNSFLNTVKVVALSDKGDFFQPYQAYIADRSYPLLRDVKIISREARMGLGTGFTAFVAGPKGQTIVLKSGIVPAFMPKRVIEVSKEPIRP